MKTEKNDDGTWTVSGELKWFNRKNLKNEEYSDEMKADLLHLEKKLRDKGLPLFGELDHNRTHNTDVISLANASHKWENLRIEDGMLKAKIEPLKTKEGTPGAILKDLLDAGLELGLAPRVAGNWDGDRFKIEHFFSIDVVTAINKKEK